MGFEEDGCRLVYVGCTFDYNPKTGEYDIPWVDVTLKRLREEIIPLKRVKVDI